MLGHMETLCLHFEDQTVFFLSFFKILCIYFLRHGEGGRKRGRKTAMGERNINWLPLTRPQWGGAWPATQACALTGN